MPNPIDMPNADTDMSADSSYYWMFYPINIGSSTSEIYSNDIRYILKQFSNELTGRTEYKEVRMEIAENSDYIELLDENPEYLKIETSNGGDSTRTNFHESCLKNSLYIQNNKFHEIVAQEGGHILSISRNDITKTSLLNPEDVDNVNYSISQEYGWKPVEWYMETSRTRFLQGTVIATNYQNNRILISVSPENNATTYKKGYSNLGPRDFISFFDRFTKIYEHDINSNPRKLYTKFKGWYTHSSSSGYSVKNILVETTRASSENSFTYNVIIEFNEPPTEFTIGQSVWTLFSKTEVSKKTSFNGTHLVEATSVNPEKGDTDARMCLDGFWLSPKFNISIPQRTNFGLCGGKYWGLGTDSFNNNSAVVFIRTPAGVTGLSSIYHKIFNEEFVLYYDYNSKNLALRRSAYSFREYPWKYEVSVGPLSSISVPTTTSSSTSTIIQLDESQERTKTLTFDNPISEFPMLFSVGVEGNYYGPIISGLGDMDLIAFDRANIEQTASLYTFGDQLVSPIVEYPYGQNCSVKSKSVQISIDPKTEGPIIISSPAGPINVSNVKIEYVGEKQIINNANRFDIINVDDDELVIVMGRSFSSFLVNYDADPVTEKSNLGGIKWQNTNGIFMIGSKDTGVTWGNPVKKFEGDDELGLLVLDSAQYCCSLFDKTLQEFKILFSGKKGTELYLGVLIINKTYLPYVNLKCTHDNNFQDFLWRPPALHPTEYEKLVKDNFVYGDDLRPIKDELIIIASESEFVNPNVLVTNVTDFGVVSTHETRDGRLVLFYDSLDGIKLLYSIDSGRTWSSSSIILAKDAQAGSYSGGLLIYITSSGIVSKILSETLLEDTFNYPEGSSGSNVELLQNTIDNQITTSLETGPIPIQKLSSHVDASGSFHVFYYDDDGRLCARKGTDFGWDANENF